MVTTKKQFELFKAEALKWIKIFEMSDFNIYFVHEKLDYAYANILTDYMGCSATIRFSTDWDDSARKISDEEIKQTAKHECIHLLLGNLANLGESRFITKDEFRKAEESLVRKLEKIIN
jgi:hypothetical protein